MAKGDRWSDDGDVKVREMRNAGTVLGVIREREFSAETAGSCSRSKDSRSGSEGGGWKRTKPVSRKGHQIRHKPSLASRLPYCTHGSGGADGKGLTTGFPQGTENPQNKLRTSPAAYPTDTGQERDACCSGILSREATAL